MKRIVAVLFACCFAASVLSAGEKAVMHCFAFTAVESATPADWDAFYKATDQLPSKIPGLTHVWYGKLAKPLAIVATEGGESQKVVRQYGACMEFKDQAALKAYAGDPAHKEWVGAYSKVRQPGTTTVDILGQ
jgi:hypothetical protein